MRINDYHLLDGASRDDFERGTIFLDTLLPNLTPDEYYLAGSVAIDYHLLNDQYRKPRQPLTGFEIVAKGLGSVSLTIADTFLVAHLHESAEPDGFCMSIVDPETALIADIFSVPALNYDPNPLIVPQEDLEIPIANHLAYATIRQLPATPPGYATCQDCIHTPRYPLTPLRNIYDTTGVLA